MGGPLGTTLRSVIPILLALSATETSPATMLLNPTSFLSSNSLLSESSPIADEMHVTRRPAQASDRLASAATSAVSGPATGLASMIAGVPG